MSSPAKEIANGVGSRTHPCSSPWSIGIRRDLKPSTQTVIDAE